MKAEDTAATSSGIRCSRTPGLNPSVRRALQDRALDYIRKDAEPEEVLRLVRRAAVGKTALSGDMALRVAESLRREPERPSFARRLEALSPRLREVVALCRRWSAPCGPRPRRTSR